METLNQFLVNTDNGLILLFSKFDTEKFTKC